MSEGEARAAGPEVGADMVPGIGASLVVLAVLLAFTALTVAVAMMELPSGLHVSAAMGIAGVKAVLVAVYFMHLAHEDRVVHVTAIAGVLLLATMLVFILVDLFNRGGG